MQHSEVYANNPIISQTGKAGSLYEKSGRLARFTITGKFEGLNIKVVFNNADIITAHPLKNPWYRIFN